MTDYAVTVVWDIQPERVPKDLPGLAAMSVSSGRPVTTAYVDATDFQDAQTQVFERWEELIFWGRAIAVTVEPVSATPHFVLAAFGR